MSIATPFGDNARSTCDIAPQLVLANLHADCSAAADLKQAVLDGLRHPVGYPDLAHASVPGDVVLFVFGKEVGDYEPITAAIVTYAQEAGITDRTFQFLLPHETLSPVVERLKQGIASLGEQAEVIVHQPHDQKANAFLTSTQENHAIILNRHLCDADLVVPIDVARSREGFGYFGPYSSIFPTYSDIDTQKRWNSPLFVTRIQRKKRRVAEVEEIRQLLGIVYNCLLVPARGGGYAAAIFGEATHVETEATRQLKQDWEPHLPSMAGVVIALITGGQAGQTWENAARALANVEHLVRPDGAIILATEIRQRPGVAMSQMAESLEFTDFEAQMRKSRHEDAAIALQFARTLAQCKVYVRTALPEVVMDDLDMIPVQSDDECRKICEHYRDVVIVHDAQNMSVRVADSTLSS
ncbi:lactate racemase domain-containing protein [Blastopirellula marina]|uniref:LarA-like N-terminal domain-containing protein n=1 Tax=Blastopirellula marina TaxID=124 RepID=A0A2S8G291_9BACT|nr:lactate racemase domain-containing protein [Blastopirellula marina]PQO38565.1 hypothetical protein C5Y98_10985 [Blastopirellula marina]PTL45222.1 DUF2088 domain-containing protein [Blastopirellula marina]